MRWDVQGEARALRRIVALLLALAQLAERAGCMALPVRVIVLAVLRHAETVAFAFACGIPLGAPGRPPLQPIPPRLPLAAQSGPADAARLAFWNRALADEGTMAKLKVAGFRGQNPLTKFLFFRLVLPFVGFAIGAVYVFVLGGLPDQPPLIKLIVCIFFAYAGFYAPVLYVSNRASKRKESIQKAWPDALDLMLICVESGMSVEAAFRRVADEIGAQSVELAEEFVLTNAELSFLQERKQAYENLAARTGLDSVKSVSQALIQAERYGTPVAHALRVLSQESRDMRMNAAEKKAAALPPKLTVPMILFFLPVLFAVILGPAGIQVSQQNIFPN